MGKKEKVIDLKPKVDKISKQHLTELQHIVNSVNGIQFNIGKIEAQKFGLLNGLSEAQDGIRVLQEKLVKEYGTYDVNLDDGTINWPKDEK
tara:strand:- start:848 stop:1120 length:273 start_codon:yes stop_codon:yes gene_type:complete